VPQSNLSLPRLGSVNATLHIAFVLKRWMRDVRVSQWCVVKWERNRWFVSSVFTIITPVFTLCDRLHANPVKVNHPPLFRVRWATLLAAVAQSTNPVLYPYLLRRLRLFQPYSCLDSYIESLLKIKLRKQCIILLVLPSLGFAVPHLSLSLRPP
jgi:hypothetical protein